MKKIIKDNYPILIGILIGIISISGVYAASTMIESDEVTYDNTTSHGDYTNVQESIDELYEINKIHKDEWQDPTLQASGNYPLLTGDLIPVEIKPNGDVYYANKHSEWYNYSEKRWANAVILKAEKKETYSEGQKIKEEDINGYFVWIPRYKYQVWHYNSDSDAIDGNTLKNENYSNSTTQALGKARLINIEFESKSTSKSEATDNTKNGDWLTHPAFTLGSKELSGIWVGKFETGKESDNVIVKPNVTSFTNKTVKEFFEAGKKYNQTLDSHMMKNTEWGAVAYLSHSEYGIGTEVRINNYEGYKTGYSAAANTDQSSYNYNSNKGEYGTIDDITQQYNTPTGYLASTTGNITGVYDMSGGAWEYMAACMENTPKDSGFSTEDLEKEMNAGYIDKYPSDTNSYSNRILGDATGEMGPFYNYYDKDNGKRYHNVWYADYSGFVASSYPWFGRGGGYDNGVLAGQFDFGGYNGGANGRIGFRLVLSPENNS